MLQNSIVSIFMIFLVISFQGMAQNIEAQIPSGNGTGNFLPPLEIAVLEDPIKMAIGDLDQDSVFDLVVCIDGGERAQILMGNGDGSFSSSQGATIAMPEEVSEIYLGQFDGDGVLDLIVYSPSNRNFYLFGGLANGDFGSPDLVYQYSDAVSAMKMADLNGDNHPDFVLSSVCGIVGCIETRILLSDGSGGMSLSSTVLSPAKAIESADVDGDGDLDLLLAGSAFPTIRTYLNQGNGEFDFVYEINTGSFYFRIMAADVMSVDQDGMPSSELDGILEIIGVPENTNSLSFMVGTGPGIFLNPLSGYDDGEIDSVGDIYLAQLDGVGAPELLYYGYGPDRMMVFIGNGVSGYPFGAISTYDLPSNPTCMRFADFNTDGILDVAVASLSNNSISIFLGEESQEVFVRGDVNGSSNINIADPVLLLESLFASGGGIPGCLDSLDANDDGLIDISDPIYVLQFLFISGTGIPLPYPDCGVDPTDDTLDCIVPLDSTCTQQP